jgi:hypothetical protein
VNILEPQQFRGPEEGLRIVAENAFVNFAGATSIFPYMP